MSVFHHVFVVICGILYVLLSVHMYVSAAFVFLVLTFCASIKSVSFGVNFRVLCLCRSAFV